MPNVASVTLGAAPVAPATPIAAASAVLTPTVTQDELNHWYKLQEELATKTQEEMDLRKKIFAAYFPTPKEGTNTAPLSEGYVIKGQYKLNRKVDEAALLVLANEMRTIGINAATLIKYKPELATTEYRKLTPEQLEVFNRALLITVGAPSLEIVLPKRAS